MKITAGVTSRPSSLIHEYNTGKDAEVSASESMRKEWKSQGNITQGIYGTKKAEKNMNSSSSSAGGGKITASAPDDSVGQLASELARAQGKLDVQQVTSKAMRSLAALRMSAVFCEGDDKKKVQQIIRRMEKLIKRAHNKVRQLTKEEQLERQQRKAEKDNNREEASKLADELRSRRKKRHKDEQNYAAKEMATDTNGSVSDTLDAMASAISAGSPAAPVSVPSVSVDVPVSAEPVSLDVIA